LGTNWSFGQSWHLATDANSVLVSVGGCANTITQATAFAKGGLATKSLSWTAPAPGAGPILFYCIVVTDINTAYNLSTNLVAVTEGAAAPGATFAAPAATTNPATPITPSGTPVQAVQNNNGAAPAGVTLSVGAIVGIAIAGVVVVGCVVANFIPVMLARRKGDDPRKAQTLVAAMYRATKEKFGGERSPSQQVKMYR